MKNFLKISKFVWYIPRNMVCLIIHGYQKTFSPDHGFMRHLFPHGYCRFTPTCSDYGHAVIKKHGVIWGGLKAFWRILRCNPWSRGGEDLPK